MAQLKIERDHPGETARYWKTDDTVIVQIGRDLDDIQARQLIREARRAYGIRRGRILPFPLIPPQLRDGARDHPTTTVAAVGVLAVGAVAGALLGTLPGDDPQTRRRPPAVAAPPPTRHPPSSPPSRESATTPPPREPRDGPPPHPGPEDGPSRPTIIPANHPPAPPDAAQDRPPPPATTPPTAEPPPRARCLLRLNALGLDVRLLCAR